MGNAHGGLQKDWGSGPSRLNCVGASILAVDCNAHAECTGLHVFMFNHISSLKRWEDFGTYDWHIQDERAFVASVISIPLRVSERMEAWIPNLWFHPKTQPSPNYCFLCRTSGITIPLFAGTKTILQELL